jgi:hypothetical protein
MAAAPPSPAPLGKTPAVAYLSRTERAERHRRSQRPDVTGAELINKRFKELEAGEPQKIKAWHPKRMRILSLERALEMTSDLAQEFYQRTKAPQIREFDRKQLATAFAILMDKFTILSGRPTQIHAFTSDAQTREGLVALGKLIAASPASEPLATPPPSTQEPTP